MRALLLLAISAFALACEVVPPPLPPPPPEPPESITAERADDETPRVVRRLVAEAQAQVDKNRQMAIELKDSRGRARAQDDADSIERELAILSSRIDNAGSDNLDDVMNRLRLLDTRIDLLHDRLRAATDRTSAVGSD